MVVLRYIVTLRNSVMQKYPIAGKSKANIRNAKRIDKIVS
jgi:hypothetical protein